MEEHACRHVAEMVMATAGHDVDGVDRDTAVLLAADLAVLAAEPSRYADYATAVRREYAHVDDGGWRAGRSAVLRTLLARPRLFAAELESTSGAPGGANLTFWSWLRSPGDGADGGWRRPRRTLMRIGTG